MNAKAMIALSGGVDSAVAAFLTQQAGIECMGATMLLCDRAFVPQADHHIADAQAVAQRMGMDFTVIDGVSQFREAVVEDFVQAYEAGLTPNPCIRCNQNLKFGFFVEKALAAGCQWVVTGHYARIRRDENTGRYLLYKALDPAKDQSYFLACLDQEQLSHIRFPLGELTKDQVRSIAAEQGFINAQKKDSQDICFIPDGDYAAFLRRYTGKTYAAGNFTDLQGKIVGRHTGAVDYTLGQRKGLGLALGAPVYVCQKDMAANTVTVGPNEALFSNALEATDWHWFPFPALTGPMAVTAKARSRHEPQAATVYPGENGTARVEFHEPQRALTPGQAIVLYDGDLVIGGGTITKIL